MFHMERDVVMEIVQVAKNKAVGLIVYEIVAIMSDRKINK